tara:strand:- start:22766 stop:23038 length:273 start_codon:yes stop_codon:yes gene_type:complete
MRRCHVPVFSFYRPVKTNFSGKSEFLDFTHPHALIGGYFAKSSDLFSLSIYLRAFTLGRNMTGFSICVKKIDFFFKYSLLQPCFKCYRSY